MVFREFATPTETSGPFGELQSLASQLFGLMTGNPQYTDNASVNLAAVDAAAARSTSNGSSGKLLLAMSETPVANYLLNPDDLSTVEQVAYSDGLPGDLTTAHPSILSDGTLLNFTRSLPNGGFHVFKQDPHTLRRTEVSWDRQQALGQAGRAILCVRRPQELQADGCRAVSSGFIVSGVGVMGPKNTQGMTQGHAQHIPSASVPPHVTAGWS